MKILDIRESTRPIQSNIRNAYIDFSKMTLSLVAVVTDVVRDDKPVIGYGFNSNGRYCQRALMRERFIPRVLKAAAASLLDSERDNCDPHTIWATLMSNEKSGGHYERSVAVGTIDMAVWDAAAKIENKPLFQVLAERHAGAETRAPINCHRPARTTLGLTLFTKRVAVNVCIPSNRCRDGCGRVALVKRLRVAHVARASPE
jgi:L-alanine-DL-glutamate epimerase-like enolase superfamily enzyme